MANSVDTDQMLHTSSSDLDLQFLLKHFCLNSWDKYGILREIILATLLN